MQCQESQFCNKSLFCSIMSITSVQLATFASTFSSHVQKLALVYANSDENFKKLYSKSNKLVKLSKESIFRMLLSYISNNVPTGAFVFVYRVMERMAIS